MAGFYHGVFFFMVLIWNPVLFLGIARMEGAFMKVTRVLNLIDFAGLTEIEE